MDKVGPVKSQFDSIMTMMRGPQLTAYALQQGLPQLTVAELAAWLEQGRAAAA